MSPLGIDVACLSSRLPGYLLSRYRRDAFSAFAILADPLVGFSVGGAGQLKVGDAKTRRQTLKKTKAEQGFVHALRSKQAVAIKQEAKGTALTIREYSRTRGDALA